MPPHRFLVGAQRKKKRRVTVSHLPECSTWNIPGEAHTGNAKRLFHVEQSQKKGSPRFAALLISFVPRGTNKSEKTAGVMKKNVPRGTFRSSHSMSMATIDILKRL